MISYQPLLYSTIVLYHNTPMYSLTICDLLSENLTGLYNSGFDIFATEIHWVKNMCYINVLIAS